MSEPLRGHVDLLLLSVLADAPAHGYALVETLREQSEGAFDLAEGTLYPALYRLERRGLVASRWKVVDGRRRRVYRLREAAGVEPARRVAGLLERRRGGRLVTIDQYLAELEAPAPAQPPAAGVGRSTRAPPRRRRHGIEPTAKLFDARRATSESGRGKVAARSGAEPPCATPASRPALALGAVAFLVFALRRPEDPLPPAQLERDPSDMTRSRSSRRALGSSPARWPR